MDTPLLTKSNGTTRSDAPATTAASNRKVKDPEYLTTIERYSIRFTRLYSQEHLEKLFLKAKKCDFVILTKLYNTDSFDCMLGFMFLPKKGFPLYVVERHMITKKSCPGLHKAMRAYLD